MTPISKATRASKDSGQQQCRTPRSTLQSEYDIPQTRSDTDFMEDIAAQIQHNH